MAQHGLLRRRSLHMCVAGVRQASGDRQRKPQAEARHLRGLAALGRLFGPGPSTQLQQGLPPVNPNGPSATAAAPRLGKLTAWEKPKPGMGDPPVPSNQAALKDARAQKARTWLAKVDPATATPSGIVSLCGTSALYGHAVNANQKSVQEFLRLSSRGLQLFALLQKYSTWRSSSHPMSGGGLGIRASVALGLRWARHDRLGRASPRPRAPGRCHGRARGCPGGHGERSRLQLLFKFAGAEKAALNGLAVQIWLFTFRSPPLYIIL